MCGIIARLLYFRMFHTEVENETPTNMIALKYKVIKSKSQHRKYSQTLKILRSSGLNNKNISEEIELLTFLIKKWNEENACVKSAKAVAILFLSDPSLPSVHNLQPFIHIGAHPPHRLALAIEQDQTPRILHLPSVYDVCGITVQLK